MIAREKQIKLTCMIMKKCVMVQYHLLRGRVVGINPSEAKVWFYILSLSFLSLSLFLLPLINYLSYMILYAFSIFFLSLFLYVSHFLLSLSLYSRPSLYLSDTSTLSDKSHEGMQSSTHH